MKLIIGEFEVEVKARKTWKHKRTNAADTMCLLNSLSILCDNAEKNYKSEGYNALAERASHWSSQIYNHLKNLGYYEDL